MIQHMKLKNLLVVAASLAAFVVGATSLVEIEDGSIVTASQLNGWNGHTGGTASAASAADYTLRFGENVTIELDSSAAVNGVFTLYANLYATKGSFTVDATGIEAIHWVGALQTRGKVTVKGAKEVRFGELVKFNSVRGRTNFAFFKSDVEFENVEATGIVFTNAVTCAKLPTSCAWSIADNTRFAVDADGLLGGGAAAFTLDRYDISLIDCAGINAGKIVVGSGRTLEIIQCQHTVMLTSGSNIYRWTWAGSGYQHITNDIEFASGSALYVFGGQHNLHFDGNVSGSPAATFAFSASGANAFFDGGVSLGGTLLFNKNNILSFKGNGPFTLGDVTVSSGLSDAKLSGNGSATLSVGAVSGMLNVEGFALEVRESPAEDAIVNLGGSGPWTVKGPVSGEPTNLDGVLVPAASGGEASFGGLLKLGNVGTTFSSVTVLDGAVLSDTTFAPSVKVSGSGRVVQAGTWWKEKVALWVDSTDTNSFVYVGDECNDWSNSDQTAYRGYTLISQWKDCRPDHDVYRFRNTRYGRDTALTGRVASVYPCDDNSFLLNGYHTVSMWNNADTSSRRINIVKTEKLNSQSPITADYAIMVFGAQSGGGSALLGTSDGYFARTPGSDRKNTGEGAGNPISNVSEFDVHINGGAAVSATSTGLSNGWQIVSMDAKKQKIYGLGARQLGTGDGGSSTASDAGFQRYAEVMLFTEAPTEFERKVAEEYLAAKWGLPCAHSDTREAVALLLGLSGAPSGSALIEYPADGIPRAITINLEVGAGTVRGANYPLVKCAAGDTFTLGSVTGSRRAEDISLAYDAETGTVFAHIAETGLMLLIK